MSYVAAIDIGGHNLRGVLADLSGRELVRAAAETNRAAADADENVDVVAGLIRRMMSESGSSLDQLACISLGVPGVVDNRAGRVLLVPNVPHWDGLQLGLALQSRLGPIPVLMDNDVNLAALGEYWRGSGQGCRSLFFMAIGTGIGGGIVIDGKTYTGSRFAAAEIGYFVLSPNQRDRRFGDFGWFESVASGFALDRAGTRLARESGTTLLRTMADESGQVKSKQVFEAAERGDEGARTLLDEAFEYLAMAVVNITALLDPEVVIVGGGMSSQGDRLLAPVRERCQGYGLEVPPLRISSLGEEAQLAGALHAAISALQR